MKKALFLFFIFISLASLSQKQGNIWYFGDHAGLNFNTNPPTFLLNGQTDFPGAPSKIWNEGCSSISDSTGSLLFYTNGQTVWDNTHSIMPNGTGLKGHWSSTQSSLIVPLPGSSQFYYLFTTDAEENNFKNGLKYSIVNLCLNNNKGDVVSSAKNITLIDTTSEKLICIRHSNGIDYWIISHQLNNNSYYSFKLTGAGITNTVVSIVGTPQFIGVGQMKASPNGLKIATATVNGFDVFGGFRSGFSTLLDFNPTTGVVSNEQVLTGSSTKTDYAVAFSPDNSKLYFSTMGHGEIYQYDLNAGNLAAIIASKVFIIPSGPDSWRQMALGPNGKIYLSRTQKKYLSVINNPNSPGLACNYIDSAIYLGGKLTSFGLPNYITGFLYSNANGICTGINQIQISNSEFRLYPNPTSGELILQTQQKENLSLEIYNTIGQLILEQKITEQETKINLRGHANGIYFIKILDEGKTIYHSKIIKH